jgi:hypothetical protein
VVIVDKKVKGYRSRRKDTPSSESPSMHFASSQTFVSRVVYFTFPFFRLSVWTDFFQGNFYVKAAAGILYLRHLFLIFFFCLEWAF